MADKRCPRCGLWNTGSAIRCDCGYDFVSNMVKESDLDQPLLSFSEPMVKGKRNFGYSIVAGAIGSFLFPCLFFAILSVGNSEVSLIEFLFLDLPILSVVIGKASIIGFVVMRALLGGVLGFAAWLILPHKKTIVVILTAFLVGLIGGAILLFFGIMSSAL